MNLAIKFFLLSSLLSFSAYCQDTLQSANVQAILYKGGGSNQQLVVGLGGSEGGNAWASERWAKTRSNFIDSGYAFLALGYFGCENTPPILDRIAIEDVYNAIAAATKDQQVSKQDIVVVGGSRGADLALLLGSYYSDISCVIGMSSSNAVFPGHTADFNTSCWTFAGKELPFVPVNDAAVPFLISRDLRGAFESMMTDSSALEKALIKVENIQGAILLLSATEDEIIPAVPMGEMIIGRLKSRKFGYPYQHIIYEGRHDETTRHFEDIFRFLKEVRKP